VTGWPRLFFAAALGGLVIVLALAMGVRPVTAFLVGWDVGVIAFLITVVHLMASAETPDIRRHAARQDVGQVLVLTLSAIAALASVAAIYAEVSAIGVEGGTTWRLLLGLATIVLSWFFVHAMFAVHYAHEYYSPLRGDLPGLEFPGKDPEPDYWDFLYVALIIGMTAQVSDVLVTGRRVRRTVLAQGIVAFWFNVAVLALLINIAADAIRG